MTKIDVPATIGPYHILGQLGRSTDSVVYHGQIKEISRDVAIKVINSERYMHEDPLMRISYEAKSVNIIRHPGVVQIFEIGNLGVNQYYIVMEYIKGENLTERSAKHGPPPATALISFIEEVSSILSYVHAKGIVHRDIKPTNLMLCEDASAPSGVRVKIVDFGLAKLPGEAQDQGRTTTGFLMGTPRYASPEQLSDASKVNAQTDVYSLGLVAYELLTNICPKPDFYNQRPPKSPAEINKEVPFEFGDLIVQMLAFKAENRPTMNAVQDACRLALFPQMEKGLGKVPVPSFDSILSNTTKNQFSKELVIEKLIPHKNKPINIHVLSEAHHYTGTIFSGLLTSADKGSEYISLRFANGANINVPLDVVSACWRHNTGTQCIAIEGHVKGNPPSEWYYFSK